MTCRPIRPGFRLRFSGFRQFEADSRRWVRSIRGFEAKVGKIFQSSFWREEGGHGPLGKPTLQSDISCIIPHRTGRKVILNPYLRNSWCRRKQGCQLAAFETTIVVSIGNEE